MALGWHGRRKGGNGRSVNVMQGFVHTCTYGFFSGVNGLSRWLASCTDINESESVWVLYDSSLKPYLIMLPAAIS